MPRFDRLGASIGSRAGEARPSWSKADWSVFWRHYVESPSGDGVMSGTSLATRHRGDIQGLRAVAVLLVALNHAGVGFLKGGYVGVDVFFVLSGYLITGLLVSSAEKTCGRREYFSSFYSRRARRILPAATLTLIVTDIAASHLLNLERAHQVLVDSVSAVFFVANFHFASIGTNYFAMGQPPSPLQHFWSLSVEEQFYLVWPLLVAAALIGVSLRRRKEGGRREAISREAHRRVEVVAVIVTVASLAYAVYDTHNSAVSAYFSSPARAWELGLGAILSLNISRVARLTPRQLAPLGWLGLLAVILASAAYSASTPFPGFAALLPTVGAVAIIAAGVHVEEARFALSRIFSLAPFRYVGDRSYTFYLWHWPVLILATEHVDHSLSLATNLLLLVGAFALSIATYALFENPIRRTSRLHGSAGLVLWPVAIAIALFIGSINWSSYQNAVNLSSFSSAPEESLSTTSSEASASQANATASSISRPSSPSALVAAAAATRRGAALPSPLIPAALALPSAEYKVPKKCIAFRGETHSASLCNLGDSSSKKSLVVFGDSHALMWMPTILSFAKREGYDVRPVLKYGCTQGGWAGRECSPWYEWAVARVRALHPSLLIIATHYNYTPKEGEMSWMGPQAAENIAGFGESVRSAAGQIAVIGDPPGEEQEPTDCLLSSHATMKTCSYLETKGQAEAIATVESATKPFGVFVDSTPWFCFRRTCPMVVGHTVVYFNKNHITTRYAEELGPLFRIALTRLLAHGGTTKPSTHTTT
jgi:peptidoglycan/LPS O-acetylase OafA/YrhL